MFTVIDIDMLTAIFQNYSTSSRSNSNTPFRVNVSYIFEVSYEKNYTTHFMG